MLRVWTAVAVALLLLSWVESRSLAPHAERGILPIDPPTPFLHMQPSGPAHDKVLVIHGLDANKEFMQLFCAALADAGFNVYAIDLPGHGASPVGFSAIGARDAVARALDYLGSVDIVVGHSLGGGLLLDIANSRTFERMVLLSPGPTPLDRPTFPNTLVVTGAFDIPAINAFAPRIEGAEWWRLPWAGHSSAVIDPNRTGQIIAWLGGDVATLHAAARLRWHLLLLTSAILLGFCLLGPSAALLVCSRPGRPQILASFALAGTAAAIVLRFIPLGAVLHLFATNYLVGMFFGMGIILCSALLSRGRAKAPAFLPSPASVVIAVAAAAYTIGIVGFWAGGVFTNFALTDGRWWRFLLIALASFPLFYLDEVAIRPGLLTAIWTRMIIGAAVLMGVLSLNRAAGFLVLITHLLIVFWIGLWIITGFIRRRTGDPVAAALFASLVQGWLFAAWFVII